MPPTTTPTRTWADRPASSGLVVTGAGAARRDGCGCVATRGHRLTPRRRGRDGRSGQARSESQRRPVRSSPWMASMTAGAAAFSTRPPTSGMDALRSPSIVIVVPVPLGASRTFGAQGDRRPGNLHDAACPSREPSAAGAAPVVGLGHREGVADDRASRSRAARRRAGRASSRCWRRHRRALTADSCCCDPASMHLASWKAGSVSIAKTATGVEA